MGDMIEMTTWPCQRNVFYKVSSSGLLFEVKSASSAAIGLAKNPGGVIQVWIVIGEDQCTWIRTEGGDGNVVRTPNILNNDQYRRFWLTWRNGFIQCGRSHERDPFVTQSFSMDLCYVTFSTRSDNPHGNPVHWRFELPPILEKPEMQIQSVTNGDIAWVPADNHLPDGALIGGYENETLYIIRASHRGSLTPGKFVPSQGTGFIPWGGRSNETLRFEVLCGFDCNWVQTSEDRIPVCAVEGGYSEDPGREKLYVGRALYDGHLIPGKVQPSHKVCYITFNGREIPKKKFEILVSPEINARCASRFFIKHIDVKGPPEPENDDDNLRDIYPVGDESDSD